MVSAGDVARIARDAVHDACEEGRIHFVCIAVNSNEPETDASVSSMGCPDMETIAFILTEALRRISAIVPSIQVVDLGDPTQN